jgi:tetratricopeptide (TPR) repeat protein
MGVLIEFWRDMRRWERHVQAAFGIALALLVLLLVVFAIGRERVPPVGLIGLFGLALAAQFIAMWGNRHLVTPYTQAQRAFIAGDFDRARAILSAHIAENSAKGAPVDADVYVLLGNALRNLGELAASRETLTMVVRQHPDSPFALYGLGRTLLVMGEYQQALTTIKKSLSLGAPSVVEFDSGYASYMLGDIQAAQDAMRRLSPHAEPYRQLMARYLLGLAGEGPGADEALLAAGLPYWRAEAQRYAATPYGQDLAALIQPLVEESQGGLRWDS